VSRANPRIKGRSVGRKALDERGEGRKALGARGACEIANEKEVTVRNPSRRARRHQWDYGDEYSNLPQPSQARNQQARVKIRGRERVEDAGFLTGSAGSCDKDSGGRVPTYTCGDTCIA
jgi:hypothetical protein